MSLWKDVAALLVLAGFVGTLQWLYATATTLHRTLETANKMKLASLVVLCCLTTATAQTAPSVEITHPKVGDEGVATEAASVCLVSGAARQCYAPENDLHMGSFGLNPKAYQLVLKPGFDAVLFTATASGGGSGSKARLALLVSKRGRLEDLLPDVTLSEQSEYRLWKEPTVSEMPLLVTADYIWQDGEAHFSGHRFRVSTYIFGLQLHNYVLQDEYITAKKYMDNGQPLQVLEKEKPEILDRLRRQSN